MKNIINIANFQNFFKLSNSKISSFTANIHKIGSEKIKLKIANNLVQNPKNLTISMDNEKSCAKSIKKFKLIGITI